MPKVVFSSDELPSEFDDKARFSCWRDFMLGVHGSLDISRLRDRPFSQRMEAAQFGGAQLVHFRGTTDRLTRTSRTVAASKSQDYFVSLNRGQTQVSLSQLGRETVLESGAAALGYGAESGDVRAKGHNAFTLVVIPPAPLRELVSGVEDLVARPLRADTAAMRYLRRYINFLSGPDGIEDDPTLATHVEATLIDLVALALGARRDAAEIARGRGLGNARLHAIKAEIRERFSSDDLSVGTIAARHGVSPRYVQALFEREGTTFTQFVLRERLALAYRLLSSQREVRRHITDIAFDAGFSDLSYFTRAFHRRYGVKPSDIRAMAISGRREFGPRETTKKVE